jgi:hypothetical protein
MKYVDLSKQHVDLKRTNYKFLGLVTKIFSEVVLKNIAHKQIRKISDE